MKEEMSKLVKIAQHLGHEWTLITGDQATYELGTVIRNKFAINKAIWPTTL
jgi:uncharacterized protein YueI